jgi:methionyl-tRNA formyltransferase
VQAKKDAERRMMRRLRIGWVGFHVEGHLALEALLEAGCGVVAVVTLADQQAAKRSAVCSYEELCRRSSVPLHRVSHINDPSSVELLWSLSLDLLFVIGWSQILGKEVLSTASSGVIGAHAALLPHNRGSAPINWAVIHGETVTGNTLMWLNEEVDEGEIIDQVQFPITPYDNCATLYGKVAESNRDMILRAVAALGRGQRPGRPQPHTDEPVLPRRRPQDGLVDWNGTGLEVYNFVRALTRPSPGAFGWLDGRRYLIWDAALLPGEPYGGLPAGRVIGPMVQPLPACAAGQVVKCGTGAVVLLEIETPDGRILKGKELSELPIQGRTWANE